MKRSMRLLVVAVAAIVGASVAWYTVVFAQNVPRDPSDETPVEAIQDSAVPADQPLERDSRFATDLGELIAAHDADAAPTFIMLNVESERLAQVDKKLQADADTLIGEYRRATNDDARKRLRDKLREMSDQHFEVRQRLRERELEHLANQLGRLRELHVRREQEKQKIVDDRVEQLVRDADGLGWGESSRIQTSQFQPFAKSGLLPEFPATPQAQVPAGVTTQMPTVERQVTSQQLPMVERGLTIEPLVAAGPPRSSRQLPTVERQLTSRQLPAGSLQQIPSESTQSVRAIPQTSARSPMPGPESLESFRGLNGDTIYFEVVGRTDGEVYGTDVYADSSSLAAAAVHAGALRKGEKGVVRVTILPGVSSYHGSERNGVRTKSFGPYVGSFHVGRPD